MGRKSRLFAHSLSSLDSRFAGHETEIAKSLRPFPRIFPFWGDYRRRRVRSGLPPDGWHLKRSVFRNPQATGPADARRGMRECARVGNRVPHDPRFTISAISRIERNRRRPTEGLPEMMGRNL